MLNLKLQNFGHPKLLEKTLILGKMQEEKEATEDEMVGWHHRLNGHEFEQTLGIGNGQGSLVWCSSWDCKESDTTKHVHRKRSGSGRKESRSGWHPKWK